ncbi:hypothetical protein BDV27DRAFT_136299 [Aspergillus caelatus]|uniref:Uncharacterized protein n=1 Tax=Aspergillus caelatus TaxID=61420 RepID=A0A5N6ZR74_9EURO|nr:uncharacterized protein BDV27DRAFT_136299 [Aspergillus caelatus]KAE8359369.1 hypothetical protein BDV27DRAFT_136299 [Aspergillus caelatus]
MQMPSGVCSIGGCEIFGDSGGSSVFLGQVPFFLPFSFSFLGLVYVRLNISTGLSRGLRSQLSVQNSTMENSVRQHVISVFDRHKEEDNEESPDLNATSSISMQWKAATCPDMDDKRWGGATLSGN